MNGPLRSGGLEMEGNRLRLLDGEGHLIADYILKLDRAQKPHSLPRAKASNSNHTALFCDFVGKFKYVLPAKVSVTNNQIHKMIQ